MYTVHLVNLSKSYEYFQQRQDELRMYQAQLKTYKENIKMVFIKRLKIYLIQLLFFISKVGIYSWYVH